MKLSTKTRYGLRAVLEIAKRGTSPVKRKEIAASQGISDSYLENILILLKSNRIVATTRGTNGGYILNRPASSITLLQVVNALEGSFDLVECVDSPLVCKKSDCCVSRTVWKELVDSWRKVLESKSIQDILDQENAISCFNYSI